jgi:hypothetical protein
MRRSAGSSGAAREPPERVLFLDENLGATAASALREAGAKVEVFRDHFKSGTPDDVWLRDVGQRGWVVLSRDQRITRNPLELKALTASEGLQVHSGRREPSRARDSQALVKSLPKIRRFLLKYNGPFLARIYSTGRVVKWS